MIALACLLPVWADTGDTGDTGVPTETPAPTDDPEPSDGPTPTGSTDTGDGALPPSAALLAEETGGFSCSSAEWGGWMAVLLAGLTVGRRRR